MNSGPGEDLPEGVDPVALQLTLLTEVWLISAAIAFRHDTATQMLLLGSIRGMAEGLRADDRGYIADILDGWVERLDAMSRAHADELRKL